MVQLGLTPWRDASELLVVREQFYPSGPAGNEDRRNTAELRHAVNLVNVWKLRGHIPHAVESTALLVDAILHHDVEKNSVFDVRAVYSTAFARFVTGYCDTQQGRAFKMSMFDMAEELNMPAHFVDMRHEITHSHLPTLQRLQLVTGEALTWLWDVYWSTLDRPKHSATDEDESRKAMPTDVDALREEFRAVLKTYVRERRTELKKNPMTKHINNACEAPSKRCLELCGNRAEALQVLVTVLVDDKLIIPSDKTLGSSMTGAFLVWNGLFTVLALRLDSFLEALVLHLVNRLIGPSDFNADEDALQEAMYKWVSNMLLFPRLATTFRNLKTSVIETCILNPDVWTLRLAEELIHYSDKDFRGQWLPALEACKLASGDSEDEQMADVDRSVHVTSVAGNGGGDSTEEAAVTDASKGQFPPSDSLAKHTRPGWHLWPGFWLPTPIGVLPDSVYPDRRLG
ncbi:rRNA-processing protein las1 [Coniosporium apollinis]|uniref:rRNA-processing protein las1 n=1 Tax=Coniosporium apollinis TaxID=61459 RepID=A0ABQ9NKP0_9PEZI|nr:rRNA-processing protein las1 [Coniosporium apollinis]